MAVIATLKTTVVTSLMEIRLIMKKVAMLIRLPQLLNSPVLLLVLMPRVLLAVVEVTIMPVQQCAGRLLQIVF